MLKQLMFQKTNISQIKGKILEMNEFFLIII